VADAASLADDVTAGNRRALARLISLVEDDAPEADETLAALYPHTGKAHVIGVTGAPGTGKSTLTNQIALEYRRRDQTVGIVAVDPTSPFSGGALLGDRIRMRDLAGDPGIFIRSMATRGSLGGLAWATADAVTALDGAGFDIVIVETVGAGQAEVEIARLAHTVIVVEAPGFGDDVQAIKAGILEIADVLVVNKADDPHAEGTARTLRAMLDLGGSMPDRRVAHHGSLADRIEPDRSQGPAGELESSWSVPVEMTNALTGEGVPELVDRLARHLEFLQRGEERERRERMRAVAAFDAWLREALLRALLANSETERMSQMVDRIVAREIMPQQAARMLVDELEWGRDSRRNA
jgi:LAO/AO transport system kinase